MVSAMPSLQAEVLLLEAAKTQLLRTADRYRISYPNRGPSKNPPGIRGQNEIFPSIAVSANLETTCDALWNLDPISTQHLFEYPINLAFHLEESFQ